MFTLDGTVTVITGAASGIGAAAARRFAAAGSDLVLADHAADGHDMDAVVADVRAAGRTVDVLEVDVRDAASVDALIATALERHGRLDAVIANAAIARVHPLSEMSEADWSETIDVDLTGVWRTFRAAVGPMRLAGHGRLLATTSTVGVLESWVNHAHYSAAKAGIAGMVRTLATELGPDGITVNAIAPGIIETPQTLDPVNSLGATGIVEVSARQAVRRIGRPEDIAAGYHFLASADASFVTGQVLVIDGGRTQQHG
ncbi:SDR family NAD(P)-dependent oxidoreductase [Herbiconiux sp. L3-i23]|uniref:SDR family NAD(P)-dependent oxidoreductase n=1 Tax=Herbiconiux sp. L3-i23 TaxID=2905871 RepID=UPI00204B9D67|nr:SDR family NAD(P)-dependent oxidoreductase [Herbiconiux sp. L3-i23]BDI21993.1 short-chain dehydrogenase [Herbiconiux sp. L3-i23]